MLILYDYNTHSPSPSQVPNNTKRLDEGILTFSGRTVVSIVVDVPKLHPTVRNRNEFSFDQTEFSQVPPTFRDIAACILDP